jgi:hypothetical protein
MVMKKMMITIMMMAALEDDECDASDVYGSG